MSAICAVLALSANTSFTDFPRVCRLLALDEYCRLDSHTGDAGSCTRTGSSCSASSPALCSSYRRNHRPADPSVRDRRLPRLHLSQAGMVGHWWRNKGPHWRKSLCINAIGALATLVTLCIVAVSKFSEGAWVTVVIIPGLVAPSSGRARATSGSGARRRIPRLSISRTCDADRRRAGTDPRQHRAQGAAPWR